MKKVLLITLILTATLSYANSQQKAPIKNITAIVKQDRTISKENMSSFVLGLKQSQCELKTTPFIEKKGDFKGMIFLFGKEICDDGKHNDAIYLAGPINLNLSKVDANKRKKILNNLKGEVNSIPLYNKVHLTKGKEIVFTKTDIISIEQQVMTIQKQLAINPKNTGKTG